MPCVAARVAALARVAQECRVRHAGQHVQCTARPTEMAGRVITIHFVVAAVAMPAAGARVQSVLAIAIIRGVSVAAAANVVRVGNQR